MPKHYRTNIEHDGGSAVVFWPPQVTVFTPEGAPVGPWEGLPTKEGKRKGARQKWLRRLGPSLLAVGFFLQLIATLFG